MGPNETASTLPGGPRVISVFDVHGCSRAQIKHFFGMQTGSRTPYGLGLMVGGRLRRLRMRFRHLIDLKGLELQTLADHARGSWTAERIGRYDPSASVCGVGDCTRLVPTLTDPRETPGPRIDRIPPARLATSVPRIKKSIFGPPISFPLISLVQYPTKRYSNGCMSRFIFDSTSLDGFSPSGRPSIGSDTLAAAALLNVGRTAKKSASSIGARGCNYSACAQRAAAICAESPADAVLHCCTVRHTTARTRAAQRSHATDRPALRAARGPRGGPGTAGR